jgi:hypothetical protein
MPEQADAQNKAQSFTEFLQCTPPNATRRITTLFVPYQQHWIVSQPDIFLHCSTCGGDRYFRCESDSIYMSHVTYKNGFLVYVCKNCQTLRKVYALAVVREKELDQDGTAMKYGEVPFFGPPVPPRAVSIIGPDRELFLMGRRAENSGFGIGSFAYYRRLVENQKGRIIEQIGDVARRLGAKPDIVKLFKQAAREVQFTKAIEIVKDAIPAGLLMDGHNPLTLLHSALSEGIHAKTDEDCLQIAQDIRVVLYELAERISEALRDEAEVKHAVNRLLSRHTRAKGDESASK